MWKVVAPKVCKETAEVINSYLEGVEGDRLINWGNSNFIRNDRNQVWGNKTEAVKRVANKQEFFTLCKDLCVPQVTAYEGPCYQHVDPTGSNGSGVKYVDKPEDFQEGVFTTKRVDGDEWRVYFCYDMEPVIFKKVRLDQSAPRQPVRNSLNGYGYLLNSPSLNRIKDLRKVLKELTKAVSNKTELNYGAVDFICSKDYTVYVLEANSAPTLLTSELVEGFTNKFVERFA